MIVLCSSRHSNKCKTSGYTTQLHHTANLVSWFYDLFRTDHNCHQALCYNVNQCSCMARNLSSTVFYTVFPTIGGGGGGGEYNPRNPPLNPPMCIGYCLLHTFFAVAVTVAIVIKELLLQPYLRLSYVLTIT